MSTAGQTSQHTLGHVDCLACEEARRAIMFHERFGDLLFPAAAEAWLQQRNKISAVTRDLYRQYFLPLQRFFGAMRLREIHVGHVQEYQRTRQAEIRARRGILPAAEQKSDGSSRINHELNALAQILHAPGLWTDIKRFYEPLPRPSRGPGMALEQEEEAHLFRVASSRARWMVAYCCGLIMRNTTARPGELRWLRVRNVDLDREHALIEEGSKNDYGVRPLPLYGDALWAMRWLMDRYLGAMQRAGVVPEPDHYILFHRAHRKGAAPDPTRPMGSWKKAHYALRAEAAAKYPRLLRFRRYDFRHTGATLLLENAAVSYSTIEKLMGHRLSSKTKRLYDHTRDASLRAAAKLIDGGHTRPGPFAAAVKKRVAAVA